MYTISPRPWELAERQLGDSVAIYVKCPAGMVASFSHTPASVGPERSAQIRGDARGVAELPALLELVYSDELRDLLRFASDGLKTRVLHLKRRLAGEAAARA